MYIKTVVRCVLLKLFYSSFISRVIIFAKRDFQEHRVCGRFAVEEWRDAKGTRRGNG